MKPRFLPGLALLSLSVAWTTLGQSSFLFRTLNRGVDAPVYDAYGVPLEGPGYLAEIWGGPTADSLSPAVRYSDWDVRLIAPFLSDGYVIAPDGVVVRSAPPGFPAALQMRAWDVSLGSTYEEVAALGLGGYGESNIFYREGGNPNLVPPTLSSPLTGLESFSLRAVIPEPSTSVLFAMGGLAALGFQRQRGSHWALIH